MSLTDYCTLDLSMSDEKKDNKPLIIEDEDIVIKYSRLQPRLNSGKSDIKSFFPNTFKVGPVFPNNSQLDNTSSIFLWLDFRFPHYVALYTSEVLKRRKWFYSSTEMFDKTEIDRKQYFYQFGKDLKQLLAGFISEERNKDFKIAVSQYNRNNQIICAQMLYMAKEFALICLGLLGGKLISWGLGVACKSMPSIALRFKNLTTAYMAGLEFLKKNFMNNSKLIPSSVSPIPSSVAKPVRELLEPVRLLNQQEMHYIIYNLEKIGIEIAAGIKALNALQTTNYIVNKAVTQPAESILKILDIIGYEKLKERLGITEDEYNPIKDYFGEKTDNVMGFIPIVSTGQSIGNVLASYIIIGKLTIKGYNLKDMCDALDHKGSEKVKAIMTDIEEMISNDEIEDLVRFLYTSQYLNVDIII